MHQRFLRLRREQRALLVASLLSLMLFAGGCGALGGQAINGSGVLVTQDHDFTNFDQLEISRAVDAEVVHSPTFSISITADDNVMDYVIVEQRDGTLRVTLDRSVSTLTNTTLVARISMPELTRVEVSGVSNVDLAGFAVTGRVDIQVSGVSTVTGALTADRVEFDLSGASRVELNGSAREASFRASGASRLELPAFTVVEATVRLSGASRADLTVTGTLREVNLSGASQLLYGGGAEVGRIETSAAATIQTR